MFRRRYLDGGDVSVLIIVVSAKYGDLPNLPTRSR
jgi:hypothetical protein